MKKYLVTGAIGFIGRNLIKAIGAEHQVITFEESE